MDSFTHNVPACVPRFAVTEYRPGATDPNSKSPVADTVALPRSMRGEIVKANPAGDSGCRASVMPPADRPSGRINVPATRTIGTN